MCVCMPFGDLSLQKKQWKFQFVLYLFKFEWRVFGALMTMFNFFPPAFT